MAEKSAVQVMGVPAVAIPVRDQDAALAFYTEVLGFELAADERVGPGFRWLEVRASDGAVGVALIAPEDGVPAGIDTGIRLAVTDATAAHAALRSTGVVVDELLLWDGAPPMFGFQDPDGNRLYLVEAG